MRVAVVSSVHRWNDTRVYLKQTRSLAAAGYDVILVAVAQEHQPFDSGGITVHPLPRRRRVWRWLNWLAIVRVVLKHRSQIVHAHDPELFPVVAALRLTGRKVVCDVHEDVAAQVMNKEWLPRIVRGPLSRLIRVALRGLPRTANVVVLAEDAYARNFPAKPNVVIVRNFPLAPTVFRTRYDSGVLKLIYVGDVRIVRGIETYVRIAHELKSRSVPVELTIVGSFANPEEERLIHDLIRELAVTDDVKLLGRRRPEEVPQLMSECDVGLALLHPIGNYRESYPTKMFEYMGAGLPVVASNFQLWTDVLVRNDCGVAVDPLHATEAVAVLYEYWKSPELRRLHGTNGRRAVLEHYRWEVEAARLLEAYTRMFAGAAV